MQKELSWSVKHSEFVMSKWWFQQQLHNFRLMRKSYSVCFTLIENRTTLHTHTESQHNTHTLTYTRICMHLCMCAFTKTAKNRYVLYSVLSTRCCVMISNKWDFFFFFSVKKVSVKSCSGVMFEHFAIYLTLYYCLQRPKKQKIVLKILNILTRVFKLISLKKWILLKILC